MSHIDRPGAFERCLNDLAGDLSPETLFALGELSAASDAWDRSLDILLADVRAGRDPHTPENVS